MHTQFQDSRRISTFTSLSFGIILLSGLVFLMLSRPKMAAAAVFTVNQNADDSFAHDANPGDGICSDLLGDCTFRAAIEEANALPGTDYITFAQVMTITLDYNQGGLPTLTGRTAIDASSVWNLPYNKPGITLRGNNINANGLTVSGGQSHIYGLTVTNFNGSGIYINSDNNIVGGESIDGKSNVLTNNGAYGLALIGQLTFNNIVHGNFIGLGPDGLTPQPNKDGVLISTGAYSNTIGRSRFGGTAGNFISGNLQHGIIIEDSFTKDNFIAGNFIGSNAAGNPNVGNGSNGILIRSGSNTKINYDTIPSNPNYIVGNGNRGIMISGGGPTYIQDNKIFSNNVAGINILNATDTTITANQIFSNNGDGVYIFGNSTIRHTITTNSIYDNQDEGIVLDGGANGGIGAPVITNVNGQTVSGTACANCLVEIFSDAADEGKKWEGWVLSNGSGQWTQTMPNPLTGPNLTATATDINTGNTSEFSSPFNIGFNGSFKAFIPGVFK